MKKPEPVAPTSVAPAADTATKSKPVAAVAPAKGAWVQVGAFRSRTVAERYIREIRAAHGGVIKGHEFLLSEQTLGKRGLFHLARLGPFRRMTDARRTCDTLKSRGAPCFVVRVR